jgi:hypothetical protein
VATETEAGEDRERRGRLGIRALASGRGKHGPVLYQSAGLHFGDGAHQALAATCKLNGRRWQDATPRLAIIYRVPLARAWWLAVGAPLE